MHNKSKIQIYREQYKFCKPYISKFNTALDIGCDFLEWSIVMIDDFEAVKAFDFRPKTKGIKKFFRRYNKAYKKHPNIKLYKHGLAEKRVTRYTKPGVGRIKGTEKSEGSSWWPVKLHTLDSFDFTNVDFIKLDCDGYEEKILQGGEQTIKNNKPVIFCELQPQRCNSHGWLTNHGYKLADTYFLDGEPHDGLYIIY